MTYSNLLKLKEFFEKNGDERQLKKVLRNLSKYVPKPEAKPVVEEEKPKTKRSKNGN